MLRIPYLWVDALCIIQNDDEERDWYEQSSEMCEIYSNAQLVISADSSPSNNVGFLPGPEFHKREWKTLHVAHPAQPTHQVTAIVREYPSNIYCEQSRPALDLQPLHRRGWALQESLLANRLLRFTSHGMRWECNTNYKDQMGFMSRAIRLAKLTRLHPETSLKLPKSELKAIYQEEGQNHSHITDYMNDITPASVYYAWQGIVAQYTNRDLTNINDRLSALSGLARLISDALPNEPEDYLAGHWRENLSNSLLWYVSKAKIVNRPPVYRAPSWSWASVDGEIKYFQERYRFHYASSLTIHSAHCEPSPLDLFGRVRSGRISVTGHVVPVALRLSSVKPPKPRYSDNGGCAGYPFSDQFTWVTSLSGEAGEGYGTLQPNDSEETIK